MAGRLLVDCLFPVYCVECGVEGDWWCRVCRGSGKNFVDYFGVSPPLDGLMAIFSYNSESPVGQLIQQFKYHHGRAIAELWAEVLPSERPTALGRVSVVPVPLYPRRERERGYNQAEVIGQLLANNWRLPFVSDTLKRVRATRQQATLSYLERAENVRGAFIALRSSPGDVILVDDVFTTGSTMAECAAVLKENGARRVFGFVLAKG